MELHIVIFQEFGIWVAQCLQFDIVGQGSKIQNAIREFQRAYLFYLEWQKENGQPYSVPYLPEAPSLYWRRWDNAQYILQHRWRLFSLPNCQQKFRLFT